MRNKKSTGVLAVLAISASALVWAFFVQGLPPHADTAAPRAIGAALAEQALALLPPGGQFYLVTRDTSAFRQPAADAAQESFLQAIKKGGASVAGGQAIELDPLRQTQVPSGDYMQVIHKAGPNSVIVSFMGPPFLTEEQRVQLGEIKPRIVALCAGNLTGPGELRRLFDQGLLHAAVVSRHLLNPSAAVKSPSDSYDAQYVAVTKATLAAVAPVGAQP